MSRKVEPQPVKDKFEMLTMLLQKPWFLHGFSFPAEEAWHIAKLFIEFDDTQPVELEVRKFQIARTDENDRKSTYELTYKRSPALYFDVIEIKAKFNLERF